MLALSNERRLLQLAVAIACCVPISAGLAGMVNGADFLSEGGADLDSHMRYLSGLLFGIGVGFGSTIRRIESYSSRFKLLTAIVVTGGAARFAGIFVAGVPSEVMVYATVMELIITPAICVWQHRIAKQYKKKLAIRKKNQ